MIIIPNGACGSDMRMTNSTGHFSATFKDPVSATWSAEYEGNSTHLDAVAAMISIRLMG